MTAGSPWKMSVVVPAVDDVDVGCCADADGDSNVGGSWVIGDDSCEWLCSSSLASAMASWNTESLVI